MRLRLAYLALAVSAAALLWCVACTASWSRDNGPNGPERVQIGAPFPGGANAGDPCESEDR